MSPLQLQHKNSYSYSLRNTIVDISLAIQKPTLNAILLENQWRCAAWKLKEEGWTV